MPRFTLLAPNPILQPPSVEMTGSKVGKTSELPSQRHYFSQLQPTHPGIGTILESETTCSICLEDFSDCSTLVIHLQPCQHLFHYGCILTWNRSARPERHTCPSCRHELYIPDPLTSEQIRELAGSRETQTSDDAVARLGPNEVLVPWEHLSVSTYAEMFVDWLINWTQESRRRRLTGGSWMMLCKMLRDKVLDEGGPLRSNFEARKDTFVLLVLAVQLLLEITRYEDATRQSSFRRFIAWMDSLLDDLGQEQFRALYTEMECHGLFQTEGYRMAVVPESFLERQKEAGDRIKSVSIEMEAQYRAQLRCKIIRRIERCVGPGRLLGHLHHHHRTPVTVLGRMSEANGRLNLVRYVRRQD